MSGECLRHETPCPALLLLKSPGKALDAYKVALKIAPSRLNLLIGSHDGLTVSLTGVRQMVKKRHLTSNRIGSINAFHEKAGRSQVNSRFILFDTFFLLARRRCRHASIRTLEERWFRSVHVGRSQFSRCCHLIGDLSFHVSVERGRRLTQLPELGFGLLSFLFLERF